MARTGITFAGVGGREAKKWNRTVRNNDSFESEGLCSEMILEDFLGTTSWLSRFMKCKNFVMRQKTRISQRLAEEFEEKVLQFQWTIIRMQQRAHCDLQLTGNMDETPLNFDMPPNRTVHAAGDKTVLIKTSGNEKNHFTVALGCMADGTKLMPMIIFKRK